MPIPRSELVDIEPTEDETDAVRDFMEEHADLAYSAEEVSDELGIRPVKKVIRILVRLEITGVVDVDYERLVFFWRKPSKKSRKPKDEKVDRFDSIIS